MTRRSAPAPWLVILLFILSSTNGLQRRTGGKNGDQLRLKRDALEAKNNLNGGESLVEKRNALQGSLLDQDKNLINSAGSTSQNAAQFIKTRDTDGVNKLTLDNGYPEKRSTNDNYVASAQDPDPLNVERKAIPGNLFPETVIHNLEQTSDKVESDMLERKSKIPERNARDTRAVYNLGEDTSVEVPLTTKVHESGAHVEGVTKRSLAGSFGNRVDDEERKEQETFIVSDDKVAKESDGLHKVTKKGRKSAARRDEVPFSGTRLLRDNLQDGDSIEDFQVKDKSADLEIHADSSGVKVKAKPASLQVVSNPHGGLKTLPGETHIRGVTAERRTFTPLLPEEEEKRRRHRHHHRLYHGLDSSPFASYPFLPRRHFHHHRRHHHRLPWLRHRQHINYPDIFERMRDQSPLPEGSSAFNPSPSIGSSFPLSSPMSSPLMNPMMPEGGAGMPQMMGGAGIDSPMMPQLPQRSPTMETNPANRFGVPESPMGEMPQMPSMNPSANMGPMGLMGSMGQSGQMGPMGQSGQMEPMGQSGQTEPMGQSRQMGPMEQTINSNPGMSSMYPMQNPMPHKGNAMEFWGIPNQDQLKALSRGENVQKVLGSNRYGENLGGIMANPIGDGERRGMMGMGGSIGGAMGGAMGGGMSGSMGGGMGGGMTGGMTGGMGGGMGMNSGMGGSSFNYNGMGNSGGMMGQFGTSGSSNGAMFNSMPNEQSSMMGNPMRRTNLFKKDDINKTEDYKKAAKRKATKAHDKKVVSGDKMAQHSKKFADLLKKAKSLVAGQKHVAKNEHAPLLREHRIKKSSKSLHDDEKR